eukprot:gene3662-biopygen6147
MSVLGVELGAPGVYGDTVGDADGGNVGSNVGTWDWGRRHNIELEASPSSSGSGDVSGSWHAVPAGHAEESDAERSHPAHYPTHLAPAQHPRITRSALSTQLHPRSLAHGAPHTHCALCWQNAAERGTGPTRTQDPERRTHLNANAAERRRHGPEHRTQVPERRTQLNANAVERRRQFAEGSGQMTHALRAAAAGAGGAVAPLAQRRSAAPQRSAAAQRGPSPAARKQADQLPDAGTLSEQEYQRRQRRGTGSRTQSGATWTQNTAESERNRTQTQLNTERKIPNAGILNAERK